MKTLITRSLVLHLASTPRLPFPPLRPCLLLINTAAGDELHRRRGRAYSTSTGSSPARRQNDEESRSIKVTVWWDFENCNIPVGVNVFRVATRITSALRFTGIKGPVTINAFGDVAQLSRSTQEALTATGVCLTHVPHSGKNSSDKSFMADLVYWVSQNPPPVHFFLISGDRDFANILHRLRMSNYNILLSSMDAASGVLCSAATIMWPWNGLVKGEDVPIKHFNHPPDGLYGSWYGHYKAPLDDPFPNAEQTAASQPRKSMELISEVKTRPIPKAVIKAILHVLHAYPEGISLSELGSEIKRNDINIDKDFFGHKKFSYFLSSMPNILKVIPHPLGDGQPLVVATQRKVVESLEPSSKHAKESEPCNGEKGRTSAQSEKLSRPINAKTSYSSHKDTDADATLGTLTTSEGKDPVVEAGKVKALDSLQSTTAYPSPKGKELGMETDACASTPLKGQEDVTEEGFFKRIWRSLTRTDDACSVEKNGIIDDGKLSIRKDSPKKAKSEEKDANLSSLHPSRSDTNSSSGSESHPSDETNGQSEVNDVAGRRMGFFSQKISWWNFWKSGAKSSADDLVSIKEVVHNQASDTSCEYAKDLTHIGCQSEAHDLFLKPFFWHFFKSFLQSGKASDVILQSRSRVELAHGLQNQGPLVKNLKYGHLLHLVELLISDKKWVGESASQTFPFKLKLPAQGNSVPSPSNGSNGLSTLFTGKASKAVLQRIQEQEKHDHNPGTLLNSSTGGLDSMSPQTFVELKSWFQKVHDDRKNIEAKDLQQLFESKFNRKLVCCLYGHSNLQNLLTACLSDTDGNQEKRERASRRDDTLSDCRKLLAELLEENPTGFNMGIFKQKFIDKYGYVLDHETLGYPKLISLLEIMPGVRMESSVVLPVAKLPVDSCSEKPPYRERLISNFEDKKQVINLEKESTNNGEDYIWEELGPVSDTVGHQTDCFEHDGGKGMSFKEASLSEEEFSDTGDDDASAVDRLERQSDEKESSLLQILDSWYSVKGGKKDQPQTADGLVDCSRGNSHIPSDVKHTDFLKQKVRKQKCYSFVSDTGDDKKEKLVDSILGSLQKGGDSRLQS